MTIEIFWSDLSERKQKEIIDEMDENIINDISPLAIVDFGDDVPED